ncbi:type VI secretion system Vgr family protein [Pseudomonas sp. H3(2019)]|uniref:type VI secretion system Vgr family protein n=1 Tax=Pseudomonas sp. H3(2019) TaxID=2598724 RepID=UPI0011978B5A|nr:type VI secretion system tip protein TssI/VgrG [Pseudomonas sp. H3(2019)]TVT84826.1 type VI secretion system tip protein VgrG [Pseudomonas sp. H3(2019)]
MHIDMESPFILTLTELALSFQVRQFSGREALNQVYCLDIEMRGPQPAMSLDRLLHQPAFLSLSPTTGIHGIIHSAGLQYCGAQQIGYSLNLAPRLLALEQQRCRRVFQQLSVPDLLRQLLAEHQLPPDSYRFELPNGEYPPRPFCIQYDETDLNLLQRLCEEEGIHYHFEHQHDRHVLVFADDSDSFAQRPVECAFHPAAPDAGQPRISQLFQCHSRPTTRPQTIFAQHASTDRATLAPDTCANQPYLDSLHPTGRPDPAQARRNQLGRRELERLRSLHRLVQGHSTLPELLSGRLLQVTGHPVPAFNDQWLLCEVLHQGETPGADKVLSAPVGYRNQFKAIPWSTAFRPALKHSRPCINGYQMAEVLGPPGMPPHLDKHGQINICLWPDSPSDRQGSSGIWLPIAHTGTGHPTLPLAGSKVHVSFLDGDPDRPVLCTGFADVQAGEPLPMVAVEQEPSATGWSGEIYLFERPPTTTECLADTTWYIVRMPRPGLKELGSLNRDDVLMTGKSQALGNLSLTLEQKQRLASEFARTPEQLCLLYPGQCVALADYFQQHWNSEQRLSFIGNASAQRQPSEARLLFDWLVNGPEATP